MPTLIVMAGGMGSRYGGLKQLDRFGVNGERIIDFTSFDAIRAGFDRIVFVIKQENLDLFKEAVGDELQKHIKVDYVFQSTDKLPEGFAANPERVKPLGTGHAVWCCKGTVNEPFCVVNADDFYGKNAFKAVCEFLEKPYGADDGIAHYCMAGFELGKTLTENGSVSRGVCKTDEQGNLLEIVENTKIEKGEKCAVSHFEGEDINLPFDTIVSMNFWGFTPDFFETLEAQLKDFLKANADNLKSEFYLPFAVDEAMKQGLCDVKVLPTSDKWHGVTYREDADGVRESLKALTEQGVYPSPLF